MGIETGRPVLQHQRTRPRPLPELPPRADVTSGATPDLHSLLRFKRSGRSRKSDGVPSWFWMLTAFVVIAASAALLRVFAV